MDRPFPTRIEPEVERNAIVLTLYAHMLSMTVELSAADGRQLAAGLIEAATTIEENHHE